jgi:hypothetical protein
MRFVILAILIAAAIFVYDAAPSSAQTASQSAHSASTRPSRLNSRRQRIDAASAMDSGLHIPQPTDMSHEFDLLNSYSLFMRGELPPTAGGRSFGGGFDSQAPENVIVFTGVTITDHATIGFVEDTTQGSVREVKVGDSIAQGKITDINLNSLGYRASDGHAVHVLVGQNLRGENAFGIIYGTGIDNNAPTETDQNVDANTASIMARMRAKRLQEMGQAPAAPATEPAQ